MKLFFDFDDVLFHTQAFVDERENIFMQHGVSSDLYRSTYDEAKFPRENGLRTYDMERHFETLLRHGASFDINKVRDELGESVLRAHRFVFDDVLGALEKFRSTGYETAIVSYGNRDFQKRKIEGSGLDMKVDRFVTGDEKKSEMLRSLLGETDRESVWFFDDAPTFLEDIKTAYPFIKTVQVAREGSRWNYPQSPYADFVARDMREILVFIGQS